MNKKGLYLIKYLKYHTKLKSDSNSKVWNINYFAGCHQPLRQGGPFITRHTDKTLSNVFVLSVRTQPT